MAKCPYCHRNLEEDEKYCYFCEQDVTKEKVKENAPNIPKLKYYELQKKLVREPGYLYFIDKQGDIARVRMKKFHETGKQKHEKVFKLGLKKEKGYLYYLDKALNVKVSRMKRGK
ncbi:MAG: hypothetical protein KJ601_00065 [Nanoarchaeota archaeon]|nr:hypothetical protein [Nanoarchaeota archaeon]MBU1703853.1 hypothetical protein [Nanoarchaeota archaeon]